MLEPAVIGSGIDKAGKPELPHVSESLHIGVLNDVIDQIARYTYESVHRIINNFPFVCKVCHPSENLSYKNIKMF